MRHVRRRNHFLRDHVEKGDIEMRYIDTERQLTDIFTKPLDSSRFADLRGGGSVFGLVCGGVGVFALFIVHFAFLLHFPHTHLSHFASHVILACICLIMLIIVLG
jgi:hypothetical protein